MHFGFRKTSLTRSLKALTTGACSGLSFAPCFPATDGRAWTRCAIRANPPPAASSGERVSVLGICSADCSNKKHVLPAPATRAFYFPVVSQV